MSQCSKRTYPSRKIARATARRACGQKAYRCHECGKFHLTSAKAVDKAYIRDLQYAIERMRRPLTAQELGQSIGLDLAAVPDGGESWSVHFNHESARGFARRLAEVSGGRLIRETRVMLPDGRTHVAISAEAGFWMVVGTRPDQVVGVPSRVKEELDKRARMWKHLGGWQ